MPAQWGGLGWGRGGCASLHVHEFSARSGQAGGRAGAPGVRWRAGKGGWMSHGERVWWGVKVTVNQDSLVYASLVLHARASCAASEEAAQTKTIRVAHGSSTS
jgi:hypothetical protein